MKIANCYLHFIIALFPALFFSSSPAFSQESPETTVMDDDLIPGTLISYATLQSIGFEWEITGDDNHNAECLVQYRVVASGTWKDALPLFRVDFEGANTLAGSILFLDPGTAYEVQLDLSDPDGGAETRTVMISTRPEPEKPTGGSTYHVIPGSGGGNGSTGNPFRGIDAAQNAAQPGDVFIVHAGDYSGRIAFTVSGDSANYIVWKAAGNGEVIFDGVDIEADHIWVEGFKIVAGGNSLVSVGAPKDVVISRNTFINCHYCIFLNGGGSNWHIVDNDITGDVDPGSGSLGGEGIELEHTDGHVVAYNRISRVADGISYPNVNVDIYGNDIFDTSDDGIEGDYALANIRIWGNRISNPLHNGITFQPMNGAPWYVLRNQVAAPGEDVIKLRDRTDRVLLVHNTFVGWSGTVASEAHRLLTMQSNNNLWISVEDKYVWENSGPGAPTWQTNLDYDGFDWGNYQYAFKWGAKYTNLGAFQAGTGLEPHGIHVNKNTTFENLNIPGPPPTPVPFQYLTLASGSDAIDAGVPLANINNGYSGSAPDLGAYEYGQPLPHYGPRASAPTALNQSPAIVPGSISLQQNYPNPFNPATNLRFRISKFGMVKLRIFDLLGREIKTLVEKSLAPGSYTVKWDGRNGQEEKVASGVYLYRIQAGGQSLTKRMLLLR